jgi:branched-chain amino acid transport system permease protein
VLAVPVLLFPLFSDNNYHIHVAVLIFINMLLASSLRLIMTTGPVSFGHAAFFAIGSYSAGLLILRAGIPFWAALPLAGLASAAMAVVIGIPTLRLRGVYFFLVTFAFGEILRLTASRWDSVTGGNQGLTGVPSPEGVTTLTANYYFGAVLLLLVFAFTALLEKSRTGAAFRAIDQQTHLAESIGVNTMGHKVFAFAAACFIAGVTGAFYVGFIHSIGPNIWDFHRSVEILTYVVVGGAASIWGPLIGAALLTVAVEFFHTFEDYAVVAYGALLLVVVMFFPRGIAGMPRVIWDLVRKLSRGRDRDGGAGEAAGGVEEEAAP